LPFRLVLSRAGPSVAESEVPVHAGRCMQGHPCLRPLVTGVRGRPVLTFPEGAIRSHAGSRARRREASVGQALLLLLFLRLLALLASLPV
jgi:hypothetical protein